MGSCPPWSGPPTEACGPSLGLFSRYFTDLLSSQMRTALPEATYSMVPEGLRAIWLIWCSPWALVMARVDVAMQASPEITWPEDLPRGKKSKATGQKSLPTKARKQVNFTQSSSEKLLLPGCLLPYLGRTASPRSRAKGRATLSPACLYDLLVCVGSFE